MDRTSFLQMITADMGWKAEFIELTKLHRPLSQNPEIEVSISPSNTTMFRLTIFLCLLCGIVVSGLGQTLTPVEVTVNTTPSPGFIYIAPNSRVPAPPYAPSLIVLDKEGAVVKSRFIPEYAFDFRVLPDGRLGYSVFQAAGSGPRASSSIYLVDSTLATRDSINGGNGYNLAMHSFMVLPNGNRLVIMQEDLIVDMSKLVPGGNPAASVQQMILQEVDITGRIIFQWRALDHFPVTVSYESLTAAAIRYFHLNAVDVDTDGNFLISARHASLVAKIHRTTGEVMWVLGGKLNQFTFGVENGISDPPEFSYQHDIRRLSNGNISLFDNGSQRTPQWSRGVEYRLDEVNKTCTLVWQYRHTPDVYAGVQGSLQTLPDGHRLMAWGSAFDDGKTLITEVDASGSLVFEAKLPNMMYPYKAEKGAYPTGRSAADVLIDEILPTNTYTYTNSTDTVGLTVTYHTLISFFYNTTTATRYQWSPESPRFVVRRGDTTAPSLPPKTVQRCRVTLTQEGMVEHAGEFRFKVDQLGIIGPEQTVVFYRDSIGKGPFRQLRTRFNPSSRELVVDTAWAGEFCFGSPLEGLPGTLLAPRPISPIAGKAVLAGQGVPLQISPQGTASSFTYDVVSTVNGLTVHASQRASDKDTTVALIPGTYHWRASSHFNAPNDTLSVSSEFSNTDSFVVRTPFVEMVEPASSVVWTHDSSYVITWNTNLVGLARIELLKDGSVVSVIRDSVKASSGGFLWRVPVTVPVGTGYVIKVRTLDGDNIAADDVTAAIVEIREISTSVEEDVMLTNISLAPNPATTTLFVGGSTPVSRIQLFALSGELVRDHELVGTGTTLNISDFSIGTYIVRLYTPHGVVSKVLSITR